MQLLGVTGLLVLSGLQAPAPREFENSLGMKFVRVVPGEFTMGEGEAPPASREEWNARDGDESPAHRVRITRPFHLGVTEVTHGQYEAFDPDHKRRQGARNHHPVTDVTWRQAVAFCRWLSEKEGRPYRLPTEAEWEYACRAGGRPPAGGHLDGKGTAEVASGRPNGWGFHDMLGNVAEWCHDWHGPYEAGVQADPVGRADGIARVTRGWSYLKVNHPAGSARYARPANRSGHLPEDANRVTGFRVAMGGMPSTPPLPVPVPSPLPERSPPAEPGKDPFYIDYAKEKRGPVLSDKAWGPIFAKWNHFTTTCVCPNGDVLAVWYSTVQESGRECAQAVSRLPAGGDRWGPAQFFFGIPDVNTHAPVLLRHGDRLIHFATQSLAGWDDAADVMRISGDDGVTWSKPRIILSRDDPMTMSQPCAAIVAGDGSLVLAVDGDRGHRDERILTSRDGGRTWTVGKGDLRKAAGRYAIHPTLVQRRDGSILTFLRGPDPMAAFATTDFGASWTKVDCALPGIGVGQKAATLRLSGGAMLIASNDRKKELVGGGTYVALSDDDGRTWSHVRKATGPVGYLSLAQGPDATIYLIGSRLRFAAFNEAWVREGKPLR